MGQSALLRQNRVRAAPSGHAMHASHHTFPTIALTKNLDTRHVYIEVIIEYNSPARLASYRAYESDDLRR